MEIGKFSFANGVFDSINTIYENYDDESLTIIKFTTLLCYNVNCTTIWCRSEYIITYDYLRLKIPAALLSLCYLMCKNSLTPLGIHFPVYNIGKTYM